MLNFGDRTKTGVSTWYGRTQWDHKIRLYKRIGLQGEPITAQNKVAFKLSKGISPLHTQQHKHAKFHDKIYRGAQVFYMHDGYTPVADFGFIFLLI